MNKLLTANHKSAAVLTLTIQIDGSLGEVMDFAREVVEKAKEQGAVDGELEFRAGLRVSINELD